MIRGIANSSICNVVLAAATVSSSLVLAPEISISGTTSFPGEICKDRVYIYEPASIFSDYSYYSSDDEMKINTLLSFSNKLLSNSKDIESDFVDLINKHFWELL